MLLKAMSVDISLFLLLEEAKESVDLPMAGGQEVRPPEWALDTAHS